jgi:hypothetical protein
MTNKVKYLVIYRCSNCGEESSFTDIDQPSCKYCEKETTMELVSQQEITPQLMEERIKALSESMLNNLQQAYQSMTSEDSAKSPEGRDAEKEMLLLLARVKSLKDKIGEMNFEEDENTSKEQPS